VSSAAAAATTTFCAGLPCLALPFLAGRPNGNIPLAVLFAVFRPLYKQQQQQRRRAARATIIT
jgi:hypothetical protein